MLLNSLACSGTFVPSKSLSLSPNFLECEIFSFQFPCHLNIKLYSSSYNRHHFVSKIRLERTPKYRPSTSGERESWLFAKLRVLIQKETIYRFSINRQSFFDICDATHCLFWNLIVNSVAVCPCQQLEITAAFWHVWEEWINEWMNERLS